MQSPPPPHPNSHPSKKRTTTIIIVVVVVAVVVFLMIGIGAWYLLRPKTAATPTTPVVTLATVGETCSATTPCATGLECQFGKCAISVGGGCDPKATTRTCVNGATCSSGGKCLSTTFQNCSADSDCYPGNHCASGNVCMPAASCSTDTDCISINGPDSLCIEGACGFSGFAELGAVCNDDIACRPSLLCRTNKCVHRAGKGTCSANSDCDPMATCVSGKCVGTIGAICTNTNDCDSRLHCEPTTGTCIPPTSCALAIDCGPSLLTEVNCNGGASVCTQQWA